MAPLSRRDSLVTANEPAPVSR